MNNNKFEVLDRSVSELNLSDDCKAYLENNGIVNLIGVINKGWKGMQETDGFDYGTFNEIIRFLDAAELVHLMEK